MRKLVTIILVCCFVLGLTSQAFALTDEEIEAQLDQGNEMLDSGQTSVVSDATLIERLKSLIDPDGKVPSLTDSQLSERLNNSSTVDIPFTSYDGNIISTRKFLNAYIILASNGYCAWGYWNHAGMYDKRYNHELLDDHVFWSAIPRAGVLLQTRRHFRRYRRAVGLRVYRVNDEQRSNCVRYARTLEGRPYSLLASKSSNTYWYCSKVPWKAYYTQANKDIDYNGGRWVTPDDIWKSPLTIPITYGS